MSRANGLSSKVNNVISVRRLRRTNECKTCIEKRIYRKKMQQKLAETGTSKTANS